MSKRVQYPDGYIGFASDKVAAILEAKGSAKIIKEGAPAAASPKPLTPEARGKLEERAVKAGVGTAEEVAKLSDGELIEKVKAAK
jgi:hypothetical protein